jgi:hypothetical protein
MRDLTGILTSVRADLARLPRILDALLGDLEAVAWRERPAPAEWSPLEIVARLRVVVDGGTRFAAIDPERWVQERAYRDADPRAALATLAERRAANLAFLDGVPPDRLRHAVTHARLGALSGLDLLAAWVTHDRLHLAQLAATLARLGARRWAPLRAEYAGPIPYGESPVQ